MKTVTSASVRQRSPAARTVLRRLSRAVAAFGNKGGLDNATRGRMHALLASFLSSSSGFVRDGAAAHTLFPSSKGKGSMFFFCQKRTGVFLFWTRCDFVSFTFAAAAARYKEGERITKNMRFFSFSFFSVLEKESADVERAFDIVHRREVSSFSFFLFCLSRCNSRENRN